MKRIYMDYAAATPVDERVIRAMMPYFADEFHNPSALYEGARRAKASLESARHEVAQAVGARPSEIVFTAGGTESINLAVHGVMEQFPDAELITSTIEHDAVLRPASRYHTVGIPVDEHGLISLEALEAAISDKTALISIMLVNNEIGTIQPLHEVVNIAERVRAGRRERKISMPLYVHTDACQAPLYIDCHVARLGVDMMSLNGGKMHGPKQSGVLYVQAGTRLRPLIEGGGQEWGLRQGTENVAFAAGFAKALQLAVKGRNTRVREVTGLRDYFMDRLEQEFSATITGHKKSRIANNVHAIFPDSDNERVLFALDDAGIDAAAGSACSASKDTSSHVLLALGKSDTEARASLRFSLGAATTKAEIDQVIDALRTALKA